jgi:hypothetical protein
MGADKKVTTDEAVPVPVPVMVGFEEDTLNVTAPPALTVPEIVRLRVTALIFPQSSDWPGPVMVPVKLPPELASEVRDG